MSNIVISPESGILEFNYNDPSGSAINLNSASIRLHGNGGNSFITGGNVGIGLSNPTSPLHLKATAVGQDGSAVTAMTKTIATSNIGAKLGFSNGSNTNNNIIGGLSLGNEGEEFAGMYAVDGGASASTHLALFVGTSAGTIEGMRVLSNGNVGIGSSAPVHELDVAGSIQAKDAGVLAGVGGDADGFIFHDLYTAGGNYWGYKALSGPNRLAIVTNGTEVITVDSNTRVGIGMSDPLDEKLQVAGNISGSGNFLGTGIGNRITAPDGKPYLVSGDAAASLTLQNVTDNGNTTTNNIGIGTTSPTQLLDVYGSESRIALTSSAGRNTVLQQGGGHFHIKSSHTNGVALNYNESTAGKLLIYSNTSENIRFASDGDSFITGGDVGIGTNSPNSKLHVYAANPNIFLEETDATSTFNVTDIQLAGGALNINTRQSNGTFVSTDYQMSKGADGVTDHKFFITGLEKVRIDSAGNVGIGTTNPVSKLTVESTANALADVDEPENHHLLLRNPANDTTEGVGMGFLVSELTNDVGAAIVCKRVGNNAQSELQFWNKQNVTADGIITQSMTIAEDGNVGIGTTNPNAELEIAASVATIRLTDSDLTNTFSEIEKGGDYLYFYSRANSSNGGFLFAGDNGTTETEFMRIATDGDVGIGSNVPSAKLDVAGGIKLLDNNYLTWNSSNTRIVGNSDYLQFQVAASDKVRITSAGNVGIGTTDPIAKINSNAQYFNPITDGNSTTFTIGTNNSASGKSNIILQSNTEVNDEIMGGVYFAHGSGQADAHRTVAAIESRVSAHGTTSLNGADLLFFTKPKGAGRGTGDPQLFIGDNEEVGIGTGDPACRFHVNCETNQEVARFESQDNEAYISIKDNTDSIYVGLDPTRDVMSLGFDIPNDSDQNLSIDTAGKVGIGTNDPQTALQVEGITTFDGDGSSRAEITSSTASSIVSLDVGGFDGSPSLARDVRFLTNPASSTKQERMRITSAGNVGIGTDNPSPTSAGRKVLQIKDTSNGAEIRAEGNGSTVNIKALTEGFIGTQGADKFHLQTNNSNRITINTDGHIGIGTTTPLSDLTVYSSDDNSATASIHCINNNETGALLRLAEGNNHMGGFLQYDGSANKFNIGVHNTSDTTFANDTKVITIDRSTANVGIGTDSPAAHLDLYNTGITSSTADVQIVGSGNTYGLIVERLTNDSRIVSKSTAGAYFLTDSAAGQFQGLELDNHWFAGLYGYGAGGYDFRIVDGTKSAGTAAITIKKTSRDVGIGTTNPSNALEIQKSSPNPPLQIRPSDGSASDLAPLILYRNQLNGSANYLLAKSIHTYFGTYNGGAPTDESEMVKISPNTSDAPSISIGDDGSAAAALNVGSSISLVNNSASFITGGNVGIGTNSAARNLSVASSSTNALIQLANSTTTYAADKGLEIFVSDSDAGIVNRENGYLRFDTNDTEAIRILANGSVGVGTDVAPHKLTVKGTISRTNNANIQVINLGTSSDAGQLTINNAGGTPKAVIESDGESYFNGGNVGIGTDNPDAPLHIKTSSNINTLRVNSAYNEGAGAVATISTSAQGNVLLLESATTSSSRELFEVKNSNGPVFDILGNGCVGVGSSIPSSKLEVSGSISDSIAVFRDDADGVEITTRGDLRQQIDFLGTNTSSINAKGSLHINYDTNNDGTNDSITFARNDDDEDGTVDMIIKEGKVGIGQTDPQLKLHISGGGIYATPVLFAADADEWLLRAGASNNAGWDYGGVKIRVNSAGGPRLAFMGFGSNEVFAIKGTNVGIGSTDPGNKLTVVGGKVEVKGSNDTSAVEGMIMRTSSSTSQGLLMVEGSSAGSLTNSLARATILSATASSTALQLGAAGVIRATIASDGNVGIGTNDPYLKFYVDGDSRVEGNLMVGDAARANTPSVPLHIKSSSTNAKLRIEDSDSSNQYWDFYVNQGDGLHFNEDTDTRVTFKEGGNVGIGTDNPEATSAGRKVLHVKDTTNGAEIRAEGDGSTVNIKALSEGFIGTQGADKFNLQTNNSNRVTIDTNGNVGIGTTSPATMLQVTGVISGSGLDISKGETNHDLGYANIGLATMGTVGYDDHAGFHHIDVTASAAQKYALLQDNNGKTFLNSATSQQISFRQNNTPVGGFDTNSDFFIDTDTLYVDVSEDAVGINNSSPAHALDVVGTYRIANNTTNSNNKLSRMLGRHYTNTEEDVNIFSVNCTSSTNFISFGGGSSDYNTATTFAFYTAANNTSTYAAGQERMRITSAGRVGIGTDNPGSTFDVNGTISSTVKSFNIQHPTQSDKRLIHACLEGPENGVYFRGKSQETGIQAPEYWSGLVHIDSMTVDVTPIGPNQSIYVDRIDDNGDICVGSNTTQPLNYFYVVYGERKDVENLEVVQDPPPPLEDESYLHE